MIHILRLRIPNVYLIVGERAVLVDSGGPNDVPRILSFLRTHGIDEGKLSLILLTHGHWDHAGGAAALKAATKAPVAIHRADAERARRGINGPLWGTTLQARVFRWVLDKSYPPVEPDVLFDEERDLSEFGVPARILFTPGHTPGSVSVRTDDGAIMVSDLMMGGWLGGWLFAASPGYHYYAEDRVQLHASMQKVLDAAPTVIHPGHGGPLDPQAVAEFVKRTSATPA